MASNYTEEEFAIMKKERNPDDIVLCPRCGKELLYISVGNSHEVKCSTDNCIKCSMRGL